MSTEQNSQVVRGSSVKKRFISTAIRSLLAALFSLILVSAYLIYRDRNLDKDFRHHVLQRMDRMDRMKSDLLDFGKFIESQQRLIQEQDAELSLILEKHQKYQKLTSADQKVVESIFRYQKEEMKSDELSTLIAGFLIGVLSSLVASGLLKLSFFRKPKAANKD